MPSREEDSLSKSVRFMVYLIASTFRFSTVVFTNFVYAISVRVPITTNTCITGKTACANPLQAEYGALLVEPRIGPEM